MPEKGPFITRNDELKLRELFVSGKNTKEKYMAWVLHMRKISVVMSQKEKEVKDEIKRKMAKKPPARLLGG